MKEFLLDLPVNYQIRRKLSNVEALYADNKAKNENSNPIVKLKAHRDSDSDLFTNVIDLFLIIYHN